MIAKKKKLITHDFLNQFLDHFSWGSRKLVGARKFRFGKDKGKYQINHDAYLMFIELYLHYKTTVPIDDDTYKVRLKFSR